MTSRPAPGIQESLQRTASGGLQRSQNRRRPSTQLNPANNTRHDVIDLTLDGEKRSAEDASQKIRPLGSIQSCQTHTRPLENIQTGQNEQARPPPRGKPQLFFNTGNNNAAENSGMPPHLSHGHLIQSPSTNVPMPPRPGSTLHDEILQQHRRITPGGSGVKKDTTSKFAGFDPPSAAILFPHGSMDFIPRFLCTS
jgi:mediator of RNA polymerase II transcription subunit 12